MIRKLFSYPIVKLVFGSGIGQLVSLIALPLVTRLYAPELFGEVAILSSCLAFSLNLMFWQSERLIVVVEDREVKSLLLANLAIGAALSILTWGIVFALAKLGVGSLGLISSELIWIFWPALIFLALLRVARLLATREKTFSQIAKASVVNSIVGVLTKIGLGLLQASSLFLMLSDLLGNFAAQGAYYKVWQKFWRKSQEPIYNFKNLVKKNRGFFLSGQISTFINSIAALLPIQFVSSGYGLKEAGLYSVAYRIVSLPQIHIGVARGDVYTARISELIRMGDIAGFKHFFHVQIKKDFLLALGIYLLIAVVSPFVFPLLFGNRWVDGGIVVTIFTLWMGAAFFVVPYSNILIILNKQRRKLAYEFFNIAIIFGTFFLFRGRSSREFFIGLSVAQMTTYVFYFFLISRTVGEMNLKESGDLSKL